MTDTISFFDFQKLDIRIGTVIEDAALSCHPQRSEGFRRTKVARRIALSTVSDVRLKMGLPATLQV